MIHLLAQLPSPEGYKAIGWIIVGLGAIAGITLTVVSIVYFVGEIRNRNRPPQVQQIGQPLIVKGEVALATREELGQVDRDSRKRRADSEAEAKELRTAMGHLLTKELFSEYRRQADESRIGIKEALSDLSGKIERFSGDNYKARRALHKKVNAHSNALHYLAGQHEHGAEIKRILENGEEGEEG